jgi:hypothetical protein
MRRIPIGVTVAVLAALPALSACGGGSQAPAALAAIRTAFDPRDFGADSATVTNQWMPWITGTRTMHKGSFKGIPQVVQALVSDQTKVIDGVTSRMVDDKDIDNGQMVEETSDYYAQDRQGNVWYMGEMTTHYVEGQLTDHADTWFAGQKGALPGIIMYADPHTQLGKPAYQQEYAPNYAEDMGQVKAFNQSVCVPLKCFGNALQIEEHSRLDPGILEEKYYVAGLGLIRSVIVNGDFEDSNLVSVTPPGA